MCRELRFLCRGMTILAVAVCLCSVHSAEAAGVLSFNATGENAANAMLATDTAGADVQASNWNNMIGRQDDGWFTGSLAAGSILDDSGATTGVTLDWEARGRYRAEGNGTDDQKMFTSEWDIGNFGSAGTDPGHNNTIFTVDNIPFGTYDVYVYAHDGGNGAQDGKRGVTATAGGQVRSLAMFFQANAADDPSGGSIEDATGSPYGYVEADSPFAFNSDPGAPPTTEIGTYLKFSGLSGSTLSLLLEPQPNPGTSRLRFTGLQIVEVPEPSSIILLSGLGVLGLGFLRRKK